MAEYLNCAPCYDGRPDYDPSLGDSELLETTSDTTLRTSDTAILTADSSSSDAKRSRVDTGLGGATMNLTCDTTVYTIDTTKLTADQTLIKVDGLFFRSKLLWFGEPDFQGQVCNSISIEILGQDTTIPPNGMIDEYDLILYFEDVEVERFSAVSGINTIDDLRALVNSSSNYVSMPARGVDVFDNGVDPTSASDVQLTALIGATGPGAGNVASVRTGPSRSLIYTATQEDAIGNPVETGGSAMLQWNFDLEYWAPYTLDADCALPADRCP